MSHTCVKTDDSSESGTTALAAATALSVRLLGWVTSQPER